ncbi:hypothetical protein H1R20_g14826, partial [Candolleomyces eurysporus]
MSATSTTSKPLHLYTYPTPNGIPVAAYLEELKAAYPGVVDYETTHVDLYKGVQKEAWFKKVNPVGQIPALVDNTRLRPVDDDKKDSDSQGFAIFDGVAILFYLAQNYDKDFKFSFNPVKEVEEFSEMVQWLMFTGSGLAPRFGECRYYRVVAPGKGSDHVVNRNVELLRNFFSVLEARLTSRDYLVGRGKGRYSLADMRAWPHIKFHEVTGIESIDEYPNLKAWLERCFERAGSKSGFEVGKA